MRNQLMPNNSMYVSMALMKTLSHKTKKQKVAYHGVLKDLRSDFYKIPLRLSGAVLFWRVI